MGDIFAMRRAPHSKASFFSPVSRSMPSSLSSRGCLEPERAFFPTIAS
jgi:hypothetical protein